MKPIYYLETAGLVALGIAGAVGCASNPEASGGGTTAESSLATLAQDGDSSFRFDGYLATADAMPEGFVEMLRRGALKSSETYNSLYFEGPVSVTATRGPSYDHVGNPVLTTIALSFEDSLGDRHLMELITPKMISEEDLARTRKVAAQGGLELWMPRSDQPRYVLVSASNQGLISASVWKHGPLIETGYKAMPTVAADIYQATGVHGFYGEKFALFADRHVQRTLGAGGVLVDGPTGDMYLPATLTSEFNRFAVHPTVNEYNNLHTPLSIRVQDGAKFVDLTFNIEGLVSEDFTFLLEDPVAVILRENDELTFVFMDREPLTLYGELVKQANNIGQIGDRDPGPVTARIAGHRAPTNRYSSYKVRY